MSQELSHCHYINRIRKSYYHMVMSLNHDNFSYISHEVKFSQALLPGILAKWFGSRGNGLATALVDASALASGCAALGFSSMGGWKQVSMAICNGYYDEYYISYHSHGIYVHVYVYAYVYVSLYYRLVCNVRSMYNT